MIYVNFVDGTYGKFLEKFLNLVFYKIDLPTSELTTNGTWHITYPSSILQSDNRFWAYHFYRQPLPPTIKKVISISCLAESEQAIAAYNWTRVADFFPFVASDILQLSYKEFINEHSLKGFEVNQRQLTCWPSEKLDSLREERTMHFWYVLCNMFKGNSSDEHSIINSWVPQGILSYVLNEIEASDKWLIDTQLEIIEFPLLSLFDDEAALSELDKLSNYLEMPILVSNEEILTILNFFRTSVRGLPNIKLVNDKFNLIVLNQDETLTDLTLHDKILLLTLVKIHYGLGSALVFAGYPVSTTEFRLIVNKLINYISI